MVPAAREPREAWGPTQRGALLLEVMLAIALFVSAGMVVLSMVGQSVGSLEASRDKQRAVDLARSAMAKLEAGIETAQVMNGPVPVWQDETESAGMDMGAPAESGWELRIETEPSGFDGLTAVTVTAKKTAGGASYTLKQLVRMSSKGEDNVGGVDEVIKEAERGAREGPAKKAAGTGGGRTAGGR